MAVSDNRPPCESPPGSIEPSGEGRLAPRRRALLPAVLLALAVVVGAELLPDWPAQAQAPPTPSALSLKATTRQPNAVYLNWARGVTMERVDLFLIEVSGGGATLPGEGAQQRRRGEYGRHMVEHRLGDGAVCERAGEADGLRGSVRGCRPRGAGPGRPRTR